MSDGVIFAMVVSIWFFFVVFTQNGVRIFVGGIITYFVYWCTIINKCQYGLTIINMPLLYWIFAAVVFKISWLLRIYDCYFETYYCCCFKITVWWFLAAIDKITWCWFVPAPRDIYGSPPNFLRLWMMGYGMNFFLICFVICKIFKMSSE